MLWKIENWRCQQVDVYMHTKNPKFLSRNEFRVPPLHSYCCYVPQAIINIAQYCCKKAEFEWGFVMIEHNSYSKSSAIDETLIKPFDFNFSTFKKAFCWIFLVPTRNTSFVCMNVQCLNGTIIWHSFNHSFTGKTDRVQHKLVSYFGHTLCTVRQYEKCNLVA